MKNRNETCTIITVEIDTNIALFCYHWYMAPSGSITNGSFCWNRFKPNQSDQWVKFVLLAGFIHRRVNHVSKIDALPTTKNIKKNTTPAKNNKQRTANRLQQDSINTYQTIPINQQQLTSKQTPHMLPCTNLQQAWTRLLQFFLLVAAWVCPGRSALQSAEQWCHRRYGHKHRVVIFIIKMWSKNVHKKGRLNNKTIPNIQKNTT